MVAKEETLQNICLLHTMETNSIEDWNSAKKFGKMYIFKNKKISLKRRL